MTYRERRLRKADRLEEWAEKRRDKSEAAFQARQTLAEQMPFGQPILVGHHSERRTRRHYERVQALDDRALEHAGKAADFETRAAGIRGQAERSIYSDDPDAIERLRERIDALEAERDRVKAYNASCRKGKPDPSLLDEKQRDDLAGLVRIGFARADLTFPAYHLSNLSGNIKRQRDRLVRLERESH